jgi:hypothetical protein
MLTVPKWWPLTTICCRPRGSGIGDAEVGELGCRVGSLGLGALDAILAALANELALKFGKAAHHGQDQLARGRGRVEPRIIEGTELGTGSLHVIEQPQQVAPL